MKMLSRGERDSKLHVVVKSLLSKLTAAQTNILSAAVVLMSAVFASRILGLIRDRTLTSNFNTADLGVFFAAFRFPDMLFQLLVMGALSTAFIPVVSGLLAKDKEKEAWKASSSLINIGLLVFFVLAIIFAIFANPVSRLLAPGFNNEQIKTMANLSRIMIFSQIFFVISNFFTGLLQSYKRFLIPAIAPILYNLGIIIGTVFLSAPYGIYGPALGVALGTFLHFVIQWPSVLKLGYRHLWVIDLKDQNLREVGKLVLPRTFGLAVNQISYTVEVILGSLLSAASVTALNLSFHLAQLPIGLFGATIGQAALPSLSEQNGKEDKESFKRIFLSSFHFILYLVLPASVILAVLKVPIVRLVFGAQKFDWWSTVLTARVLLALSLGIWAQSLIHLLARAFYALHDSKTPVILGAITAAIGILISVVFVLILKLPAWSLALASSVADILYAVFLFYFLQRKVGAFHKSEVIIPFLKMFIATIITGISLYIPLKLLDQLVFDTTRTINLIALTGTVGFIGLSVYVFLTWLLEIKEAETFLRLLKKVGNYRINLLSTKEVIVP